MPINQSIASMMPPHLATTDGTVAHVNQDGESDDRYSTYSSLSSTVTTHSPVRPRSGGQLPSHTNRTSKVASMPSNGANNDVTSIDLARNHNRANEDGRTNLIHTDQTKGDGIVAGANAERERQKRNSNQSSSSSATYSSRHSTFEDASYSYSSYTDSQRTKSNSQPPSHNARFRDDGTAPSQSSRTSTAPPKHSARDDHTAAPRKRSTDDSLSSLSSSYYTYSSSSKSLASRFNSFDLSYSSYDNRSEGVTGSYSESDGDSSTTHTAESAWQEAVTRSHPASPPQDANLSHTYSTRAATVAREMVIVQIPPLPAPPAPPIPSHCFVAADSPDNDMHVFLTRVLAIQQAYEARRLGSRAGTLFTAVEYEPPRRHGRARLRSPTAPRAAVSVSTSTSTAAAAATAAEEEVRRGCATFTPTPSGRCSARTTRLALGVLRLTHMERQAVMTNVTSSIVPLHELREVFTRCALVRIKEAVAQQLLSADPFRHGELPLRQVAEQLHALGVAASSGASGMRINVHVPPHSRPDVLCMTMESTVCDAADPTCREDGAHSSAAAAATTPAGLSHTRRTRFIDVCRMAHAYAHGRVRTVYDTDSIMSALAILPRLITWRDSLVYLGSDAVCSGVTTREQFASLQREMEMAVYVCLLTQLYTVRDCHTDQVMVQYPHLIRGILLQSSAAPPPRQRRGRAFSPTKTVATEEEPSLPLLSIAMVHLFRSLYHPAAYLTAHRNGKETSLYGEGGAAESTLQVTADCVVKRCRNVVPRTTPDGCSFLPPGSSGTLGQDDRRSSVPSEGKEADRGERVRMDVALRSATVYTTTAVPVRCYCLVSTVAADGVYLPAVMVPVRETAHVKAGRREGGGRATNDSIRTMSWTFDKAASREDEPVLHFDGPATDRLYMEFCYETEEPSCGEGRDTTQVVVWCAGYATASWTELQSGKLTVRQGSWLDDSFETVPARNAAAVQKKGGFWSLLRRQKRVVDHPEDGNCISAMKIKVFRTHKESAHEAASMDLPDRYLVMRRHRRLISQLRETIRYMGGQCAYETQALGQYNVRQIFLVSSNVTLMDQLLVLWLSDFAKFTSRKNETSQMKAKRMLQCVTQLAALNNVWGTKTESLARCIIKQKRISNNINESTARQPVCI